MSASPIDDVLGACYGPPCGSCGKLRTRNPSRTCTPCLREKNRHCGRCLGSGSVLLEKARGLEGCPPCNGTGLRLRTIV